MEKETKRAIASGALKYMGNHNLKQSAFATLCGVRKEYINIILKEGSDFMYSSGQTTGLIPTRHFVKIAEYIGFATEKVYWELQPTAQMSVMIATLQDAKKFGYTNLIIGETGCGKSAISALFKSRNPADVFIVTVGKNDNIGDLIEKTVEALNINTDARTKSKKLKEIMSKLKSMRADGHSPMIIFDESEYMKQVALCSMKELHDYLVGHAAVIMIGTHQLIKNIEVLRKRDKPGIPQFYRRIKFGIRTLPPIDRDYPIFLNDIEDRNLVSFLKQNCDNYGELHDVLVPAMREADRTGEPLTEQFVRKVLGMPDNKAA